METNVLRRYANDATKKLVGGRNAYERFGSFCINHDAIMQSIVNVEKFCPKNRRYRLESLSTDGVSASVSLRIVMTEEEAKRFSGDEEGDDADGGVWGVASPHFQPSGWFFPYPSTTVAALRRLP